MSTPTNITYLNTAACGLVNEEVRRAGVSLYEGFEQNGSTHAEHWRFNEQDRIRQHLADFMGAPVANVAFVPNFSWALNAVAHALKGKKNRVALYKNDYPSVPEPFRLLGFDITWIDTPDGFNIDIEQLENCIRNRSVDMVVISNVQWTSGYKLDMAMIGTLCKAHGVLFIVDATQSLGAMPIDVSSLPVDVFISSNYKWMNAGFGTGVMYMADSFVKEYPPVVIGFNSYTMRDGKWIYEPSVRNYEPGHPNMFGLNLMEAAILQKNKLGLAAIEQHNHALTATLLAGLKELPVSLVGGYDMHNRSSIVVLKDENGLGDWLKQHNIIVTQRNGLLRISIHFYNTPADINSFIDCVKTKYL